MSLCCCRKYWQNVTLCYQKTNSAQTWIGQISLSDGLFWADPCQIRSVATNANQLEYLLRDKVICLLQTFLTASLWLAVTAFIIVVCPLWRIHCSHCSIHRRIVCCKANHKMDLTGCWIFVRRSKMFFGLGFLFLTEKSLWELWIKKNRKKIQNNHKWHKT